MTPQEKHHQSTISTFLQSHPLPLAITLVASLIAVLTFVFNDPARGWLTSTYEARPWLIMLALVLLIVLLALQNRKLHRELESTGRKADAELFGKLRELLPSNAGAISFIDQFNMAGFPFDSDRLIPLYHFRYDWNNVEHEFLDPELEAKRAKLLSLVKEYLTEIGFSTFPTDSGRQTVPPEWEEEQPERFDRVVASLHDKAGKIVEAHQDLFRAARSALED